MDTATDFSLDCQELAQHGNLKREAFQALLSKHGAIRHSEIVFSFPDGSSATWDEGTESFILKGTEP